MPDDPTMAPHELAQAFDQRERDPELLKKLATPAGRLSHAHDLAMGRSAAYRRLAELLKADNHGEITEDLVERARSARTEAHMLVLLFYFGPMKTAHVGERLAADIAEEMKGRL